VVEISAPENINRVIITSHPIPSTLYDVTKGSEKLVGATRSAFTTASEKILDLVVPDWRNINTTFMQGSASNLEEVMALKPDLIIAYGNEQMQGLELLTVPVLNFYENTKDNEETTINRDRFMREIFGVTGAGTLQDEWNTANARITESLRQVQGQKPIKALMIMDNTGSRITVRGTNTYGDSWIVKSGMVNVSSVNGDGVEVSLEQIYRWNPEIIILQGGKPEKEYLANTIGGQDWSQVQAVKDRKVYYAPKGISGWAAPNADSPMMAQWMIMKAYPQTYPEEEFIAELIRYYQRRYNIAVTEEIAREVIYPNGR
jgi:iron complex transport system substrate-binding protein